ncbi:Alpha-ketoglutarate-dependent dioxygenase alkB 7, mitochondrial [Linnemannia zychae]|nr:Alpha-ketoglutarate-dependent dioxygenase alkB 7, mitochondrial [Linnemannia zychae]
MTDRISNTFNSAVGGAKQSIGETIGNPNLAASGAEQKAQADAAQKAADAKTHAEGIGHKIQGQVQQTVGSAVGNNSMEARGHANEVRGDLERKDDATSTYHYTALSTPASIAETHFDLTNIPANEHAQILKDFILVPDYLSPEEHDMMVREATRKLKRALGKQLRYEDGHFDGVITRYRECSAGDWAMSSHPLSSDSNATTTPTTTRKERTTPQEMMASIKREFFPHSWNWVSPHILELEAGQGGIKPHVDHLDASGSVVAGLCLGSSAVMELIHQDDPEKRFRVLLPKRCFYFQRDAVRYSYMHGIPIEEEDHSFRGTVVKKEKRISVMLRNALDPSLQNNRSTTTTTMY